MYFLYRTWNRYKIQNENTFFVLILYLETYFNFGFCTHSLFYNENMLPQKKSHSRNYCNPWSVYKIQNEKNISKYKIYNENIFLFLILYTHLYYNETFLLYILFNENMFP